MRYKAFDRNGGHWEFCDANGNVTGTCGIASMNDDMLTATDEGTLYLTYIIADGIYPADPGDPNLEYLTQEDLERGAVVEIRIYEDEHVEDELELVDGDPLVMEIDPEEKKLQTDLDEIDNLEFGVVDEDGNWQEEQPAAIQADGQVKALTPEELFEVQWAYDGPQSGLFIDRGDVYIYQEGVYLIYASYRGIWSNPLQLVVTAPVQTPVYEEGYDPAYTPDIDPGYEQEAPAAEPEPVMEEAPVQ